MRLTQIKLAGFKSFVDSTTIAVPGQLVGVVGPNGCGKSNIIDAVRWVLGESKASALRGDSMQDVIFNGSGNRKPVSRAAVELIFANAPEDGKPAAGAWGQYSEIAVKRVLTRQGDSSYFINNQAVRRKDVQDIFLGTGLGARAYAIIEQGMISRVIEAKPEELRIFLEEAAGVSKYKERRKETEARLSQARENLTRVEDILRELDGQLVKLGDQAQIAQQFRDLTAEQTQKQHLLWFLRREEAVAEQTRIAAELALATLSLDEGTAALRNFEKQLETLRQAHYAAGDTLHVAQSELYGASSEVSRLESEIKRIVDARGRLSNQIASLDGQRAQWQQQTEALTLALGDWEGGTARAAETLEMSTIEAQTLRERLPDAEEGLRAAQDAFNESRQALSAIEQKMQLEGAHQTNAARALEALTVRLERLSSEKKTLVEPDLDVLNQAREELARREMEFEERRERLERAEADAPTTEAARRAAQAAFETATRSSAELEARLSALTALQESVAKSGKLEPWLAKHEIAQLPRLWKKIHVETGWEAALEAILRERLQALEMRDLSWVKSFFVDAPPAKLAFYTPQVSVPAAVPPGLRSLQDMVRADDVNLKGLLGDWLSGIFIADDAAQALSQRASLPARGAFVTKAGHVITAHTVTFYAPDNEQSGMLARANEIDNLGLAIKAKALLVDETRGAQARADAALSRLTNELSELRPQVANAQSRLHELQLDVLRQEQIAERYAGRARQIADDQGEIVAAQEEERMRMTEAESAFAQLDEEVANGSNKVEELRDKMADAEEALSQARERARTSERAHQEAEFALRQARSKIEEIKTSQTNVARQLERVTADTETARAELDTLHDEAIQSGLQEALDARMAKEQALARIRTDLDALTQQLRGMDEDRLRAEQKLDPLRGRLSELQLKEQAARLSQEQFAQQLVEAQADEAPLLELVALANAPTDGSEPKPYRPAYLQGEVTRLGNSIASLGAVNLAALDELKAATERKNFLDAQYGDLTEATTTLEDAIRKIDRETRVLLQDTFQKVNEHFGKLFPTLFGGGEARLIMSGDEILDAGVQVMAQPPGKKNQSIQLLSGGEKALTASALVFAMFQLNPAPFCLLDEVDAPLDDSNTERFARLVKKMSQDTQFLFISHNKITMEIAEQLIGVTMQEQGVSRIVAVDIGEALQMRQAA